MRSDKGFFTDAVDFVIETVMDYPKTATVVFVAVIILLFVAKS
jgi:hypothetical protein